MKTIRALLFIIIFLACAGAASAQTTTTLTGTLYKADGVTPNPGGVLTLFEVVQTNGPVITRGPIYYRTNSSGQLLGLNGAVGISIRRNSLARLYSDSPGFSDTRAGVWYYIPDAPTATLDTLQRWVSGTFYLAATTGTGFRLEAPALTTGNAISFVVPNTGHTGNILNVRKANGAVVFNIDASGTMTVGSAAVNIGALTEDASPDGASDYVMTWDASAGTAKKVLLDNLPGGGGGGDVASVFGRTGAVVAANNDYSFSQISGSVTDGQVPDTISLTNITQIGTRPHASLQSLGADDHTQYHTDARALAWLAARSTTDLPEGGNLYFTNARVTALLVDANIPNTITLDNLTQVVTRDYSSLQNIPSTFSPSAHASSHQHGGSDQVATSTPGANAIPKAGSGGLLAAGWLQEVIGLVDLSDVAGKRGNGTSVQMTTGSVATDDCAKFDANGNIVSAGAACEAGGGATTALDNLASVAVNTSLISDTDNTDDLGSTAKMWRSGFFGTSVRVGGMYLQPSGINGSTFALLAGDFNTYRSWIGHSYRLGPDDSNAFDAGIDRDISGFTRFIGPGGGAGGFTLSEVSANPAAPTQDVQLRGYLKGDKFVIIFNNGGATRYFTLDLTQSGATATWSQSTSAP